MSHLSSPPSANASRSFPGSFTGLPTATSIGIIFAALFTGALIAVYVGSIGWPLLVFFAVSVIVAVTCVQPKGLFLTAMSTPLLFVLTLLGTGFALSRQQMASGGTSSKAALLTIVYPLLDLFPVLVSVSTAGLLIALVRYALLSKQNDEIRRRERAQRRSVARSNRRTSAEGRRARERTQGGVTVHELMARAKQEGSRRTSRGQRPSRVARRLGEDLYRQP